MSCFKWFVFSCVFIYSHLASGIDGLNPLQHIPDNGWQGFEILTQQDDVSHVSDPVYGETTLWGKYDGLGAYRKSADTLTIDINHETTPAAISGIELDYFSFRQAIDSTIDAGTTPFPDSFVQAVGFAYSSIYDANFHATTNPGPVASGSAAVLAYGNDNFSRFCSGSTHRANRFGQGRGFVDPMYLTGEEVSGGRFYALDVETRAFWEAPDLGFAKWENAAQLDTGNDTHVALILSSDESSSPGDYLRLYIGEKDVDANSDGQIDFLERNGLRGGATYYFAPDPGFSLTDLPSGTLPGSWQAETAGALLETKLEDVHTSPTDGSQVVFADQTDGVFILTSDLAFGANGFDLQATDVSILQIDDDNVAPIGAPDNLTWPTEHRIYVQEDGDGDGMFEIALDTNTVTQISRGLAEPSGIEDISLRMGYEPGSVFIVSIQGGGQTGGQLSVLISPTAAKISLGDFDNDATYTCHDVDALVAQIVSGTNEPDFDISRDGLVDERDLETWLAEAGAANLASGKAYLNGDTNLDGVVDGVDFIRWNENRFTSSAAWCNGDFNADGIVDGLDFILWNENKFTSADSTTVPEPATCWLIMLSAITLNRIRGR